MNRLALLCFLLQSTLIASFQYAKTVHHFQPLLAKKGDGGDVTMQQSFAIGTFIEFEEKKRVHIGKIEEKEHKANGGARYKVIDQNGKQYQIADKAVHFAMACPTSPGPAAKLFDDFCAAFEFSQKQLESKLDISTDLLAMAWEEASEDEDHADLTPGNLIELIHAHAASNMEKYMAWRLLQTESAHVFFKDIKDHGRVVSFRARAKKAVESAKQAFCNSHEDEDLCFV